MLRNKSSDLSENGNVFLFILLGVVLFAALAFVISRGFRSDTTTAMSERQAELIAVDILSYTQQLQRAVGKLQQKGVSENDLSFDSPAQAGYTHTPAEQDFQKIFHISGGGISWKNAPARANNGSPWHFTGRTCIPGIGTGAAGCGINTVPDEELIVVLPNVNAAICAVLDKKLGISSIPANSGGAYSSVKFTGPFADGTEINIGASHNAACYRHGANYHFYYVLIAR